MDMDRQSMQIRSRVWFVLPLPALWEVIIHFSCSGLERISISEQVYSRSEGASY